MSQTDERWMGISDARANLTEVIAEVRILDRPLVLTRREKPQAVLVSVDFYERALTALGEERVLVPRDAPAEAGGTTDATDS